MHVYKVFIYGRNVGVCIGGEDDFFHLSFSKENNYSPNARKCYLLVTQCDTRMILEDGTANQNTISTTTSNGQIYCCVNFRNMEISSRTHAYACVCVCGV